MVPGGMSTFPSRCSDSGRRLEKAPLGDGTKRYGKEGAHVSHLSSTGVTNELAEHMAPFSSLSSSLSRCCNPKLPPHLETWKGDIVVAESLDVLDSSAKLRVNPRREELSVPNDDAGTGNTVVEPPTLPTETTLALMVLDITP